MSIAFFDLDKTLLAVNSASLWFRAELRGGYVTWSQAAQAFAALSVYHLGFGKVDGWLLQNVAQMAGQPEDVIRERTKRFYADEVRHQFRPGARMAIERHRAAGDRLVLLTTSTNYLSEPVKEELRLDGFLCNRFEVDAGGRYTGKPLGPLCYGPGKLTLGKAYADALGVPLSQCSFYSDSATDVPMMEAVGTPVAVNPDPRLRRIAQQRGWEIADWGAPPA